MKTQTNDLRKVLLVFGILASVAGTALADVVTYQFGTSDQRANISFESVTDFETVLGSTNQVTGYVKSDLAKGKAQIELQVPVASFNTGIAMRDEHLRSAGWLDAEKYPVITFVSNGAKKSGENDWSVDGKFTMHGVTKNIEAKVNVRLIPRDVAKQAGLEAGDWLKVATTFEVKLSDYGVKIPKMAAAKVNDTWKVTFLAYANSVSQPVAMNPCNPCGGKKAVVAANPCNPCAGKKAMAAANPCNPCVAKKDQ